MTQWQQALLTRQVEDSLPFNFTLTPIIQTGFPGRSAGFCADHGGHVQLVPKSAFEISLGLTSVLAL